MDQAQKLREYMHQHSASQGRGKSARVITITSGRSGVGKSNFTLNFALGLQSIGKKVIVLDLDLSNANVNILMGISPKYTLVDVLYRETRILDVLEKGPMGVEYISGGIDIQDPLEIDQNALSFFWSQIQELQTYADFILLDTGAGAGISKELVDIILASDETILVTTPEQISIADSYTVLKKVHQSQKQAPKFRLIVNRAKSYREAVETSRSLKNACRQFLKMELETLGFLMEDLHIRQAVEMQTPFFMEYPECEASKNIKQIVFYYSPEIEKRSSLAPKGIKGIFEKLLTLGKSS